MKVNGRSSISSSRWRDDWLTEAEVWSSSWERRASICMSASALILPASILRSSSSWARLSLSSFSSASSFFWTIFWTWLMCLFADLVVGVEDLLAGQLEDDGLLGRLAHLVLQGLLQLLAFLDDRVELLGDVLVVALLEGGALLVDLAQLVIALGLDLGDLGVDAAACSRSETEISSSRRLRAFLRASSST